MADWPPKKNATFTVEFPIYDNDGDPVTAAAALDSEVSIDGGAFADCTNEAAEITGGNGIYSLALTAAEMNGDIIAVVTKTTTTDAKTAVNMMYTATRQLIDLAFPNTSGRGLEVETDGMAHADLKEWLGVAPNALQTGRVDSYVGAMAADVITAASIALDAIGSSELATTAVNEIRDAILSDSTPFAGANIDAAISSRSSHSAADAADAVLDEDMTAHQTQGTLGQAIGDPVADIDTIYGMLTDLEDGVTVVQANVASIAANAITAAAIATDAFTSDEFATSALQEIADTIFQRDMDQVEAAAPVHSLAVAVLAAVSRVRDNAGTQEIYQTDGSTLKASRTITTSAALDPISELGVAA